jgi:hypothetical protein
MQNGAVELTAEEGLLRHFRAEYGLPDTTRPVRVAISIDDRLPAGAVIDLHGGHKTVTWSVSLGRVGADPLRATLALGGRPRWFGVSLVQGFIIEPLIGLACAVGGQVLLPAAAIAEKGGALLIIGRSRSGKSSVSARALALGRQVLGDDQVLVDPGGVIGPFPRRMRVYDDLMETSPMVVRALPPRARLGLRLRRVVRIATRGFVAPSLALPRSAFGGARAAVAMPVHRIVVVRRSATAHELSMEPMAPEDVRSEAMDILREQRRGLSRLERDDWLTLLRSVAEREAAMLDAALRGAPAYRATVPEAWGAPWAVEALAQALDIT